jgi:hypothetical protein
LYEQLLAVAQDIAFRKPHGAVAQALRLDPRASHTLRRAAQDIRTGGFTFSPRRGVLIPKRGGPGHRGLKISDRPLDRVVDAWLGRHLRRLLETATGLPIFVVRRVQHWGRNGYVHARRFDFRDYFDTVAHDLLLARLHACGLPDVLLSLVGSYLAAPTCLRDGSVEDGRGLAQGGSSSMALAIFYTAPLRDAIAAMGEVTMALYVDDGVVLAKSRAALRAAEKVLARVSAELGLVLHDSARKNWRGIVDEGVPFLGWVIRPSFLEIARDRIAAFRARLTREVRRSLSVAQAISRVNHRLTREHVLVHRRVGWLRYYCAASTDAAFLHLDRAVRTSIRDRFGKRLTNTRLTVMGLGSAVLRARQLRRGA